MRCGEIEKQSKGMIWRWVGVVVVVLGKSHIAPEISYRQREGKGMIAAGVSRMKAEADYGDDYGAGDCVWGKGDLLIGCCSWPLGRESERPKELLFGPIIARPKIYRGSIWIKQFMADAYRGGYVWQYIWQ